MPESTQSEKIQSRRGKTIFADEEAFVALKRLAEDEAVLAGISSGAVVAKAVEVAETMESGVIVTVFPDGAWKYLSERIWTEDPREVSERFTGPLW